MEGGSSDCDGTASPVQKWNGSWASVIHVCLWVASIEARIRDTEEAFKAEFRGLAKVELWECSCGD